MCDRVGIKYFEIAHFFTQWGAQHAPKVIATVDGVEKRIFGWDTDAFGEEYRTFLRSFVTEFLAHMKKSGNDEDADTDQFLSSFSAGGVSMSFSSAESSAGESTDTEDFEELKQILWEIPRELYRKYRTNKNCYWRV
jgi:hypothetical protein